MILFSKIKKHQSASFTTISLAALTTLSLFLIACGGSGDNIEVETPEVTVTTLSTPT